MENIQNNFVKKKSQFKKESALRKIHFDLTDLAGILTASVKSIDFVYTLEFAESNNISSSQ